MFSSCDFVDRSFCPEKLRMIHEVTLINTKPKHSRLELDPTFEAKPLQWETTEDGVGARCVRGASDLDQVDMKR